MSPGQRTCFHERTKSVENSRLASVLMRKSGRRRTRLTCRISRYPVTGLGAAATRLRRIHHLHTRIDCDRFPFPFPIFVPRQNRFAPPPWIATTEQNAPRALTSIHMSRHRRQLSFRVPLVRQGLDRDNNNEKCRISPQRTVTIERDRPTKRELSAPPPIDRGRPTDLA